MKYKVITTWKQSLAVSKMPGELAEKGPPEVWLFSHQGGMWTRWEFFTLHVWWVRYFYPQQQLIHEGYDYPICDQILTCASCPQSSHFNMCLHMARPSCSIYLIDFSILSKAYKRRDLPIRCTGRRIFLDILELGCHRKWQLIPVPGDLYCLLGVYLSRSMAAWRKIAAMHIRGVGSPCHAICQH